MTAIEFLRRYRPNSLVKSSARGEYQLAEHDSFKINGESSVWHWKSRDIGGKSALKYLIYVEGVPFVEAVQLLCEESPTYIPVQHEAVERERPPFRLPNPAPNNDRVTRYLLGRGVSLSAIRYCIERKILYESAEYHNCVFLGKDPQGVPKYAALRGIYDYGKPFKREAPGSQKQYGFCIPPMQPGTTVAVFEVSLSAIRYCIERKIHAEYHNWFSWATRAPTLRGIYARLMGNAAFKRRSHHPDPVLIEKKILYESAEYHNCVFWEKTRRACRNMRRCAVFMTMGNRVCQKQ